MQKILAQKAQDTDIKTSRRRLLCPLCGKHTILWLLPSTEIIDLPIKCKLCGNESIVSVTPISDD